MLNLLVALKQAATDSSAKAGNELVNQKINKANKLARNSILLALSLHKLNVIPHSTGAILKVMLSTILGNASRVTEDLEAAKNR